VEKSNLPLIGVALAALIAFLPSSGVIKPLPSPDSLDAADEAYRALLADTVETLEVEKTEKGSEAFAKALADVRKTTHAAPTKEIVALKWNGKGEEAARRIRERTLGQNPEVPIE
jgi:hypothetical protein